MSKKKTALLALLLVAIGAAILLLLLKRRTAVEASADPLELFSGNCNAVAVVPSLGQLGAGVSGLPKLRLAEVAASLQGYPNAEGFMAELNRELGFDLRDPNSIRAAGIDPDRPLVVFMPPQGGSVLAVPASDESKLEQMLVRHAADRLAATVRGSVKAGERVIQTLSEPNKPAPSVAWALWRRSLIAAAGNNAVEAVRAALEQKPESSLALDARLGALRPKLAGAQAWAYMCPSFVTSPARAELFPYGAGVGLWASASELRLGVQAPLTEAMAAQAGALTAPVDPELLKRLDPTSFLLVGFGGDPALLQPYLSLFVEMVPNPAARRPILDAAQAILAGLKPGVAAGLKLASSASFAAVPELDLRRTNPFDYVALSALGRARDPAGAAQLMDQLSALGPLLGAKFESREVGGAKVVTARYHLGEGASVALRDGWVLATGGQGQLDPALARLAGPGTFPVSEPGAAKALAHDGAFLYLDIPRLAEAVKAVPDSAWGVGGFAIRAAVSNWMDALAQIRGLRLSASTEEKTLSVQLVLTLAGEPAPAAEVGK